MRICICCSLSFTDEVKKIAEDLKKLGHEVLLPNGIMTDAIHKPDFNPVTAKRDNGYDAIREHFDKIKESDAILVCNFTKNNIENYIGANTFLEMGFAYYIGKPIFTFNPLPDYKYINDEILSFDAKALNGDFGEMTL